MVRRGVSLCWQRCSKYGSLCVARLYVFVRIRFNAFKAKKRDQHPRARPMTPELPSTCYGAAAGKRKEPSLGAQAAPPPSAVPPMLTVYRPHKRILVREEDTKVSPRLWRSRPVTMPPCSTELRDTNAKANQLRMWRSVQGKSDEELLAAVQVHISRDHPELVGNCHRKTF